MRCNRLGDEEGLSLRHAHLAGRDGARAGARHLVIEVAVDDVVVGAAGPAHDDGADEKQHQQFQVGQPAAGTVVFESTRR